MSDSPLIPVVCDRCRAEGLAGSDPFEAFGDLLDFEPVPRRKHRRDGWDAECQRAFVAALSLTGSVRAAARAVDKAAYGVDQLLATPGSESFAAAMDEAFAIAAGERSRRLAEGLRAVAAEEAGWRPPDPPWAKAAARAPAPRPRPRAEPEEESDAKHLAACYDILHKYMLKIRQEREARLAGRIVAADFYVRQATFLEVVLDLASGGGGAGFDLLMNFRHQGLDLLEIAETPMSRLLGAARRAKWAELGEPPRPEHPPERYLEHHDGFATEPSECTRGGQALSPKEQEAIFDERHKADAQAQVEWEAEARRDYERRRAAEPAETKGAGSQPPPLGEEPGEAGQPAPEGDRTDVTGFTPVTAPTPTDPKEPRDET